MKRIRAWTTALSLSLVAMPFPAAAEDGYALWLRSVAPSVGQVNVRVSGASPTLDLAGAELRRALPAGTPPGLVATASDPALRPLRLPFEGLCQEGYLVFSNVAQHV